MKASVFIRTALIDQMQQIADLGLWFHLAKLLPSGVEVLAWTAYGNTPEFKVGIRVGRGALMIAVQNLYTFIFPGGYHHAPMSKDFYCVDSGGIWLTSEPGSAKLHLTYREDEVKVATSTPPSAELYIHVPQWFADFKAACQIVLDKIEAGELQDIEVLKMLEND